MTNPTAFAAPPRGRSSRSSSPPAPMPRCPPASRRAPAIEGITEYRLANGLTVLLFPDASKPTTTVNVTYRVGSAYENYGETGMAHLLEHLVFKGTPNRGNIMTELGKRGMHFNGTTGWDRTNYFESFTASSDNLDWALAMEADRMVNSYIRRSDLDSEMTVVRNEFESGENNPQLVLYGKMLATAYQWHNYGTRADRRARRHRERQHRAAAGVLQALLPAGQRGADRRRQVRSRRRRSRSSPSTSARSRSPRASCPPIYTIDPVQDGERIGDAAPRRQLASSSA